MCVVGFEVLIASETVENEPSYAIGEWMSEVFNTIDPSTICFIFDVKFGEFARGINVKLIFSDFNNITRTVSLFNYDITTRDAIAKELFGMFEFHFKNATKYQVC